MNKDIIITTLRIPQYMYDQLKKIAKNREDSLNTVMKLAIEFYLENKSI